MKAAIAGVSVAVVCACGPSPVSFSRPVAPPRPQGEAPAPALVLLPAVDQRPPVERSGARPGVPLRLSFVGVTMQWRSGANVADEDRLVWLRSSFDRLAPSAQTTLSSDLGAALGEALGVPVSFEPVPRPSEAALREVAARQRDALVVMPVLDHLTAVAPESGFTIASSGRDDMGRQVVSSSDVGRTTGEQWTVMVRVHCVLVRDGRVVGHVVRYAAASGWDPQKAYSEALGLAAREAAGAFEPPRRQPDPAIDPPAAPL